MHNNIGVALKPNFMSLCRELYFLIYAFSSIPLKISNLQNRRPKIFAFHILGLNAAFIPMYHVKAAQDDIS